MEGGVEIVNRKADVMDTRPAFGHELPDGRIIGFGLQEFDKRLTGSDASDTSAVSVVEWDFGELEQVAVEGQDGFEVAHGNAEMRDAGATWV